MVRVKMAIDDSYSETLTYKSQCMRCKHFRIEGKCDAYPDGIPMPIWTAKEKHDKPRSDDHGKQYEPL